VDDELKFITEMSFTLRRWRSAIDAELEPIGLFGSLWATFWWIAESETPPIQRELADRIGVGGPSLVHQLDVLEKQGLVCRKPSPDDRRSKQINLTPKGQTVFKRIHEISASLARDAFSDLSKAELRNARNAIRKIRKALLSRKDEVIHARKRKS